jgi:hypothetical protein
LAANNVLQPNVTSRLSSFITVFKKKGAKGDKKKWVTVAHRRAMP